MDTNITPRAADHGIEDFFIDRWSPRGFGPEAISEAELIALLEAARWAPSGLNAQPWRFIYHFRGEPGFNVLAETLWDINQLWAPKAAALIAVAAKTTMIMPGGDSEEPNPTYAFDVGAAWAQFAIQAHLRGWITHAIGGLDTEVVREQAGLPQDFKVLAAVAIGKQGSAADLPEFLQQLEKPNGRRSITDSAFHRNFHGG